jgi:hypothetical protein
MTARERYVTFVCEVCDHLGLESEYTEPFDAESDDWSPDRCEEHLDYVWDEEKGTYVDPEAEEEEEEEDYSEEETVVGVIAAQCARAARLKREEEDRADYEERQRD